MICEHYNWPYLGPLAIKGKLVSIRIWDDQGISFAIRRTFAYAVNVHVSDMVIIF